MNEKNLSVLEQYNLDIKSVKRGRGSYIVSAEQGLFLLKEYRGSNERAKWIANVCERLENGGMWADMPILNKDGEYICRDSREDKSFLLKKWIYGTEMDVKNKEDIKAAVVNLVEIHLLLRNKEMNSREEVLYKEHDFEKRIREMKRIYRYIKGKKKKNIFEINFMNHYGKYEEMALAALELSKLESVRAVQKKAWDEGLVCHGEYNQHNVLNVQQKMISVNYENCKIGLQTEDLYLFMRKILEKNNWSIELAELMMKTYLNKRHMEKGELEEFYGKFLFVEKFWKIANHYYNSKKTWIPDQSRQKLDKLENQFRLRKEFLQYLKRTYIS